MPQVTKAKPAPFFGPKQHGTMPFLGVKREPQARRGPESASVRLSVCLFSHLWTYSACVCPFSGCKIGPHGQTAFEGLSRSEAAWHDGILPPEKAPSRPTLAHSLCFYVMGWSQESYPASESAPGTPQKSGRMASLGFLPKDRFTRPTPHLKVVQKRPKKRSPAKKKRRVEFHVFGPLRPRVMLMENPAPQDTFVFPSFTR